jgi:hypothetical protein
MSTVITTNVTLKFRTPLKAFSVGIEVVRTQPASGKPGNDGCLAATKMLFPPVSLAFGNIPLSTLDLDSVIF